MEKIIARKRAEELFNMGFETVRVTGYMGDLADYREKIFDNIKIVEHYIEDMPQNYYIQVSGVN